MKKKLIGIALVVVLALSITGCGNKESLADQVEDYHKLGVEGNTTNWNVIFEEGCDTSKYDYTDFLDVIKHCIDASSTSGVSIVAFDSDNMTRFAWDSTAPLTVTQYDGNAPNIHTSEWQLTAEDYNEIRGK